MLTLWVHLGAICSTIVAAVAVAVVVAALGKYFNFSATSPRSATRASYLFALIVYQFDIEIFAIQIIVGITFAPVILILDISVGRPPLAPLSPSPSRCCCR